jgi:hypothetical protein
MAVSLDDHIVYKFGHKLVQQAKRVYRSVETYHETTFDQVFADDFQFTPYLKARLVSCGLDTCSAVHYEDASAYEWRIHERAKQVPFFVDLILAH